MTTTSSESDTDTEYEDDDNDNTVYDAMDEENLSEDSDDESSTYNIQGVDQNSLRDVRVVDRVNSETASSFFKIHINGREKMMHKQTACWYLTEEKKSLSAGRGRRMME